MRWKIGRQRRMSRGFRTSTVGSTREGSASGLRPAQRVHHLAARPRRLGRQVGRDAVDAIGEQRHQQLADLAAPVRIARVARISAPQRRRQGRVLRPHGVREHQEARVVRIERQRRRGREGRRGRIDQQALVRPDRLGDALGVSVS